MTYAPYVSVGEYIAELRDNGFTVIPDDVSIRARVVAQWTGEYTSYYDPKLRKLVVVLHSKLRDLLGLEVTS